MSDKTPASRLQALIAGAELTQEQAAEMMTRQGGGRPVSKRTVQSWLADPRLPSARPCPEWAPDLLAAALAREEGGA